MVANRVAQLVRWAEYVSSRESGCGSLSADQPAESADAVLAKSAWDTRSESAASKVMFRGTDELGEFAVKHA